MMNKKVILEDEVIRSPNSFGVRHRPYMKTSDGVSRIRERGR